MTYLTKFLREEEAQDMVEYSLLLAFVALSISAAWMGFGPSIIGIASKRNDYLVLANTIAQ